MTVKSFMTSPRSLSLLENIRPSSKSLEGENTRRWVKARLHWRRFFGKNVSNSDIIFTCLGHLERFDTDRIIVSICGVALPKVAKASTVVTVACRAAGVIAQDLANGK